MPRYKVFLVYISNVCDDLPAKDVARSGAFASVPGRADVRVQRRLQPAGGCRTPPAGEAERRGPFGVGHRGTSRRARGVAGFATQYQVSVGSMRPLNQVTPSPSWLLAQACAAAWSSARSVRAMSRPST